MVIAAALFFMREDWTKSLRNAVFGPYSLSEAEWSELENPQGTFKEFVTLQGTVLPVSALDNVPIQRHGRYGLPKTRMEHYVLLNVGQQAVLVRLEKPQTIPLGTVSLTGELRAMPAVESQFNLALPGERGVFLPTTKSLHSFVENDALRTRVAQVVVDTVGARWYRVEVLGSAAIVGIFCVLLVGVFVWSFFANLKRTIPWLQLVQRGDPEVLAKQIEKERFAQETIRIGDVYIGSQWLIVDGRFVFSLAHLDDLMGFGLQKMEGNRYVTFLLNLYLRSGQVAGGKIKEKEYTALSQLLHQRYPWLHEDTDRTWEKQWKKRKDEFIAQVLARKEAVSLPIQV